MEEKKERNADEIHDSMKRTEKMKQILIGNSIHNGSNKSAPLEKQITERKPRKPTRSTR